MSKKYIFINSIVQFSGHTPSGISRSTLALLEQFGKTENYIDKHVSELMKIYSSNVIL